MKAKALALKERCFHWEQESSREADHPFNQILKAKMDEILHKYTKSLEYSPSDSNQVFTT